MTVPTDDHRDVWLFFAFAYAFSWLFWIPNALLAHGVALPAALAGFLAAPLNPAAFGPLVSAVVLTLRREGGRGVLRLLQRGVDFRFPKVWLAPILLLPPVVFGGAIVAALLAAGREPDLSVLSNPAYALIGFFVILFTSGPLQEEFGWRGYALPRLQTRWNPLAASVILGIFWWLWHLPAVFIPGRFMADNLPTFLALGVVIVLTSVLFGWVYNHTGGSVAAALLLHTAMNWSIWLVLPAMKLDLQVAAFMILFLAVAVLAVLRVWGGGRPRIGARRR